MANIMGQPNPEMLSHEMRSQRRMQLVYARKTQERRIFMEDLSDYRKRKDRATLREIKKSMGPKWYQVLSVPQTMALDTVEFSMYQDLLEGRPRRTQLVIRALGILPRPSTDDLMYCIYCGREDPKEMFAELFLIRYEHSYDVKRSNYDLNARVILTAMLYLGMPHLLKLLQEQFQPDQPAPPPKPKPKRKPAPPLASPYLQKMIAICYEPQQWVKKGPPPLPNLEVLDELVEETPPMFKPSPPPPPPPPPPKKRLPRSFCDKLAGVNLYSSESHSPGSYFPTTTCLRKTYESKRSLAPNLLQRPDFMATEKKVYGIGNTRKSAKVKGRKPKPPSTGHLNTQYVICGIVKVRGKSVYVLGSVSILPLKGNIIHGGHVMLNGQNINIHLGIRGEQPPMKTGHCDCVKKWTEKAFSYLKQSKCYCGHRYDYYNEGVFPPEDLPFFEKPTRYGPMQINYDNIYNLDPKSVHVGKEFKRIWETDSALFVEDPTKKKPQPKKKKKLSKTCLGLEPKPEDYLKCALARMRRLNIAARLPDAHLVPELVTWMHRRLYGDYTLKEKKQMQTKSNLYWCLFSRFDNHRIPHVPVPKVAKYKDLSTWNYKQALTDSFRKFVYQQRLKLFRAYAEYSNMMWPSMFQAQMPDKKFREIYFSYLFGTLDQLSLMHPYNHVESETSYATSLKRRYRCPLQCVEKF